MKRRITTLLLTFIMLFSMSNVCFDDAKVVDAGEKEIIKEEIETESLQVTPREATISMLLNAGWTMAEINDWYTEDDLKELDENVKAVSNSTRYTVGYENSETGEVETQDLSRQEFEYGVNQDSCQQDDHDNTKLGTVSSSGILELQPVYGWGDMDSDTPNDDIYFGYESGGFSGASIYNADSECYLKQNMGLMWMGNDTYCVQYRYEWMKEPFYKLTDHFAVALGDDLAVDIEPRQAFTFKYNLLGTEYVEKITESSQTSTFCYNWCSIKYSTWQGRQVKISWPSADNGCIVGCHLRGFLTFFATINSRHRSLEFSVYAQYFHGKVLVNENASIGGFEGSSIKPRLNYATETHHMVVRAKNPYADEILTVKGNINKGK